MRLEAIACFALLIGALGGCELIAPLDDVRPDQGGASGAGAVGGTGGGAGISGSGALGGSGAGGAAASAGTGGSSAGGGASGSAGCGNCLGGACVAGKCQPVLLASGQDGPEYPVVDDTHVYWTNAGSVARVAKTGGDVETLTTAGIQNEGCAVDDAQVFFADRGGHTIYAAPKTGGSANALAQAQSLPQTVAVDATYVYWTSSGDGAIRRMPKGGGTVEDLAIDQPDAYAIAVDGNEVFWARTTGEIAKLSTAACCAVTSLASGYGAGVLAIAVDPTHVYWISQSGSNARRVPRGGGSSDEVGFASLPDGLAVDATWVYVGQDANPGSIHRMLKDGTSGDVAATGQNHPRGIALDAEAIYWANTDAGEIYKLAK